MTYHDRHLISPAGVAMAEPGKYQDRYLVSPVGRAVRWSGAKDSTVEALKERGWTEPPKYKWDEIYEEQGGENDDGPDRAA